MSDEDSTATNADGLEAGMIRRRTLLKGAAAAGVGAAIWTTPVIVDSLASPAAAFTPAAVYAGFASGGTLSLHDVESLSNHEFKASALGMYERGDRVISVPRLLRLAEIYDVPVSELLSLRTNDRDTAGARRTRAAPDSDVLIDLVKLHQIDDDPDTALIARFVSTIQEFRGNAEQETFTFRRADLGRLAAVTGQSADDLEQRLEQLRLPSASWSSALVRVARSSWDPRDKGARSCERTLATGWSSRDTTWANPIGTRRSSRCTATTAARRWENDGREGSTSPDLMRRSSTCPIAARRPEHVWRPLEPSAVADTCPWTLSQEKRPRS
jgi:transcriptional regulator with XRE-family HTH domain